MTLGSCTLQAHLLDLAPYFDAICVASRVTSKVKVMTEMLGFGTDTLKMVLFNHGRHRSFTSVLRHQLMPAVHRGALRFDGKHPYHYALLAGAAGWLHKDVVDKTSLETQHPLATDTGTHLLTLPLCCCAAVPTLPPCRPATLPPCRPAALPPCHLPPAALPPCRPAALPPCRPAALPPCRRAAQLTSHTLASPLHLLAKGGFPEDAYAIVLAEVRTSDGHKRKQPKKKKTAQSKGVPVPDAPDARQDPSPKWAGTIGEPHPLCKWAQMGAEHTHQIFTLLPNSSSGGLLVMNILPWPGARWGVLVIRVVECPSSAMLKRKQETMESDWLRTFPPSEPCAPRSIWAHGNGGHLHSRMLEYAMYSESGIHPAVEMLRRIQAGMASLIHHI